jgi:hypothetical protein
MKMIAKMTGEGWEKRRKGVLTWRCPNCGKTALLGFKKKKSKGSRMLILVEVCALCKHETSTRVFDPKKKEFVKGRRKK